MRLAFVDYVLEPDKPGRSGLSDVVWNTAAQFAALGDDVHIFGPYTVTSPEARGVTVHRFPLPPIGYRNIVGHVLIVLRAWQMIRRLGSIDAIHAPEYLSTGVIAPLSRVPVIVTTPGHIEERIANGNPFDWWTTQVFRLAARSSSRRCALVHAISDDMAMWWRGTGTAPDRLVVIPHGVDTEAFRRTANPAEARAQLGLDPRSPLVVYAGRLSAEKCVRVLLDALVTVREEMPAARLAILGDGPQRAELAARAEGLGIKACVTFRGNVDRNELPTWYSAAQAVVLPSASEGLPRVMLEAMACGATFIGTPISGVRDQVRHGENGFLTPVGDVPALATQLKDVLASDELAQRVGVSAAAYAREHLTWPLVSRRLRDAISARLARIGRSGST